MDISFSTSLLYIAGIAVVLVLTLAGTAISQVLGVRVHRPRFKLKQRKEIPAYLTELYEDAITQLSELGFEYHHSELSRDIVSHEQADKWSVVMLHRGKKVYAEISPASTFLDMPGYEIDFWSLAKDGTVLLTVNGRSHTMLCDIPGAIVHDPFVESIANQYYAHSKQQKKLSIDKEIVTPSPLGYIKLQQTLMDAYFLKLIRERIVVSTGKNEFRIAFAKSFGLLYQIVTGEKQIQKLLLSKQNKLAHRSLVNPDEYPEDSTTAAKNQYPPQAQLQAFNRLNSLRNRHSAGTARKVLLFTITLIVSYFAFGLVFSFNSVLIILAVILFHELGHIAAMFMFGYKDMQILFVPLLGAAAIGKSDDVPVWKQVIVYLMGPLPGIVVALLILSTFDNISNATTWLFETAMIMLVINYLNLLPFVPLDGGRIIQLTIMERFPTGKLVFSGISGLAFASGGYLLGEPVLWALAVFMFASLPFNRLESSVLKEYKKHEKELNGSEPHSKLLHLFKTFNLPKFNKLNFSDRFNVANSLREIILKPNQAGFVSSMGLVGIYLCLLLLTPPAVVVSTMGIDTTAAIFSALANQNTVRNWEVEIAKQRDPEKRLELILEAARYFLFTDNTIKSIQYLQQAEAEASALDQPELLAELHESYWLYYQKMGDYLQAEPALRKSIQFLEQAEPINAYQLTISYQTLANFNAQQDNLPAQETNLLSALSYTSQIENNEQRIVVTTILDQLIGVYYAKQQYDLAIAVLQNSLSDSVKHQDNHNTYITRFIYHELGWLYYHKQDIPTALQEFSFALRADNQVGMKQPVADIQFADIFNSMLTANIYLSLATIQFKQDNSSLADNNFNNALNAIGQLQMASIDEYIQSKTVEFAPDLSNETGRYKSKRWEFIAEVYRAKTENQLVNETLIIQ